MRVMIFAAGGDLGGGKTHIVDLSGKLKDRCELKLVSFRKGSLSRETAALGVDTVELDSSCGFLHAVKESRRLYDEFKPDIVHCQGPKANLIGFLLKLSRPEMLFISTVHSDPKLDYLGQRFKQLTNGNLNAFSIKRTDYCVTVSDCMKNILVKRGYDPYRLFTVFNGLDFDGAKTSFRKKEENETINVGIAARLTPVKDIPTLLKAFAYAAERNGRLRLFIAGSGEEEKNLKDITAQLGLSDKVFFKGWVSDIKSFFDDIDINVLSSISENFPYVLLEGAYQHCATVSSNVGGIPALIEHGITGYLFEPGDSTALGEYILKLSEDEALRKELADNLQRRAAADFSLESMVKNQLAVYESILARHKRPKRSGAVLCGAYGRGNSGDSAILNAICLELKSIDPDIPIWVMSRNPEETKLTEGVRSFHIFNIPAFLKALKQSVLFVNGGGSLIQDVTSSRSLYFYLFTLLAAKRLGCRVLMYGCGIGPIRKPENRKMAAKVLNKSADIITLRDGVSLELLNEIGVNKPEIKLAADPVFSLPKADPEKVCAAFEMEGIPADVPKACFCIREWPVFTGESEIAKAAEYTYEKYGLVPVFYPIEIPKDLKITEKTAALLSCPHYVCRQIHPANVQIGMLGSMDVVCGMRLHSLIFATAGGSPVVGISYDVKVDGFIRDIGSELCLACEGLRASDIEAYIDRALSDGRAESLKIMEELNSREKYNGESAGKLLGA